MSIQVACPECGRKVIVPEELHGQPVPCPTCGRPVTAPTNPCSRPFPETTITPQPGEVPPASVLPPLVAELASESAREPPETCPLCGRKIPGDARFCSGCGVEFGDEDSQPWEEEGEIRRDFLPHRGGLVLTLGILSTVFGPMSFCLGLLAGLLALVGIGLGIPAVVMGRRDLKKMDARLMDPAGRGSTQAGFICGIVGICLCSLIGLVMTVIGVIYGWLIYNMGIWGKPSMGAVPVATAKSPAVKPLPPLQREPVEEDVEPPEEIPGLKPNPVEKPVQKRGARGAAPKILPRGASP